MSSGVASRHSSRTTCSTASTSAGSPSSSTRSTRRVAAREVPLALDRVVEAQDRRGRAASEDAAARVEAVLEAREPERGPHLAGRRRMDAQAGARDHAERALAAHEQLGEVGPDRGAWRAAGVHHPAVGEGDVEPQHHVLDLPVAGGQLARAPARQPAADGGEVDRLGPVAEGDVVIAAQRGLQGSAERTGPHVEHERRCRRRPRSR